MTGVQSPKEPWCDFPQGSFGLQAIKMAKDLKYTTSKEQINHSKRHGLLFDNELITTRNLDIYYQFSHQTITVIYIAKIQLVIPFPEIHNPPSPDYTAGYDSIQAGQSHKSRPSFHSAP